MTKPPALPDRSRLFSEPLLVVRRKPEIRDSTPLYAILDQHGVRVAACQPDRSRHVSIGHVAKAEASWQR
jgi:hypothetical protein